MDGHPAGAATAPPYRFTWGSLVAENGPHLVEALAWDAAGNAGRATLGVVLANPGVAAPDPARGAPVCIAVGPRCDSQRLLAGRAGTEVGTPNTLGGTCADGAEYPWHWDLDRVLLVASDGGDLAAGKRVRVLAWPGHGGGATAHVFVADDAAAPAWRYVGTTDMPAGGGEVEFTAGPGPFQAVRVSYPGIYTAFPPPPCAPGGIFEQDDLVAALAPGLPDRQPPQVTLAAPATADPYPAVVHLSATASDDVLLQRVELEADGQVLRVLTAPPFEADWSTWTAGRHRLVARAVDGAGNVAESAADVQVQDAGAPQVFIGFDSGYGGVVPRDVVVWVYASDPVGADRLELAVDGRPISPGPWHAPTLGRHTFTALATDGAGNVGTASREVLVDGQPPDVAFTSPAAGATVAGPVLVELAVSDDDLVSTGNLYLDGAVLRYLGNTPPYAVTWDAGLAVNGPHRLTATFEDRAGNVRTVEREVVVANPGVAAWDPARRVPACLDVRADCDSGGLLAGLDVEPHRPNTLGAGCLDGTPTLGGVERVRVATLDGSPFAPGAAVEIQVTQVGSYSGSRLFLFHAADADAPDWKLVTMIPQPKAFETSARATFTLPPGTRQAIRARLAHWSLGDQEPHPCELSVPSLSWRINDHDDLVFAVRDGAAPQVAILAPAPGSTVAGDVTVLASAQDDGGLAEVVLLVDGAPVARRTGPPWALPWDAWAAAPGPHALSIRATDLTGLATESLPIGVTVGLSAGLAAHDATLGAPRCPAPGPSCDSGLTLGGRGPVGPEPDAPNALGLSCQDGGAGQAGLDESVERIHVEALGGGDVAPAARSASTSPTGPTPPATRSTSSGPPTPGRRPGRRWPPSRPRRAACRPARRRSPCPPGRRSRRCAPASPGTARRPPAATAPTTTTTTSW